MSSRAAWPLSLGFLVLAVGTSHGSAPPVVRIDAHGDPLPPGALARYGTVRLHHEGLGAIEFTHEGKRLLSFAGNLGLEVRQWDVASGKLLGESLLNFVDSMQPIAFAPDGGIYLAGQGGVRFMNGLDSTSRRIYTEPIAFLEKAVVSSDAKSLAIARRDGGILLLAAPEGKVRLRLELENPAKTELRGMAVSHDGKLLARAFSDNRVVVWDTSRRQQVHSFTTGSIQERGAPLFSPRGDLLFVPGQGLYSWVLDLGTGKTITGFHPATDRLQSYCFGPDGKQLLAVDNKLRLYRYDVQTGKEISVAPIPVPIREYADQVAFSSNGKTLAVARGATISLVDLQTGKCMHPWRRERQPLGTARFSRSKEVASRTEAGQIEYWDPRTGKHLRTRSLPKDDRLHGIDRDGTLALTQTASRSWRVLRVSDQKELWTAEQDTFQVAGKFSPDGRRIVTASASAIEIRDATTGKVRQSWPVEFPQGFRSIDWSPCGRLVSVLDSLTNRVTIYDVETAKPRHVLPTFLATGAAFCRTAKKLAVVSGDGVIRVYELGQPKPLFETVIRTAGGQTTISSPRGRVGIDVTGSDSAGPPMAISPDGRFLAAACLGDIRVWDMTGRPVRLFRGHESFVWDLAFDEAGAKLVSASQDGTALIWDMAGVK